MCLCCDAARMLLWCAQCRQGVLRGSAACAQVLYFAEFDLQFFKTRSEMLRHLSKCRLQHPPGDEIYRNRTKKGSVSMYEVRLSSYGREAHSRRHMRPSKQYSLLAFLYKR